MRHLSKLLLTAALAALLAIPVFSQGPGRGFGTPSMEKLATNEGVQKELKLSDDQASKLKKAAEDLQSKYGDQLKEAKKDKEKRAEITKKMEAEFTKTLDDTLKPEQRKRFNQIHVQTQGLSAFQDETVVKALKLTDKQKDELKGMADDFAKDTQGMFKDAGKDKDKLAEVQKKIATMRKETLEKAASKLTDDQKKAWKDLVGEPFELQLGGKGKDK
jgi:hypothetical protein